MGCGAGGMTSWLLLVLPVLLPRGFQSFQEQNDLNDGAMECPNGRTENDGPEFIQNCEENDEWNTRVTERWSRTTDSEVRVATDLSCYLKSDLLYAVCTWRAHAASNDSTFLLHLWNNNTSDLFTFSAASSTQCTIGHQDIYVQEFTTVWVELCTRGCCYESTNIALLFSDSVKYDSPTIQEFSKSEGELTMKWERLKEQTLLKAARFKAEGDANWTEVSCVFPEKNDFGDFETCSLILEKNVPFEIQVRLKSQNRESLWSEWSKSVDIPAEIVEGPELNFSVGNLSDSGQRKLDMNWKKARREEGEVNYILTVQLVTCPCKHKELLISGTSLSINISGGTYNISISAANAAGLGPARSYVIESHQQAGIPFMNASLSGSNEVHVWWALTQNRSRAYCIEWQPVSENSTPGVCRKKKLARGTYTHNGTVEPMTCYRIAIYGFVTRKTYENKAWKTLGFMHYYKPSKEEGPRNVTVKDIEAYSATVRWEDFFTSKCPGVLQNYIVTIYSSHGKNTSKAHEAKTSGTHYNLTNLSAATEYTIEIKGETKLGEETGISRKVFITLKTDEKAAIWKLPAIFIGILLGVATTAALWFFGVKRFKKIVCPEVPNPFHSTAVKFFEDQIQQVHTQKALICSSRSLEETGPVDVLTTVLNTEMDVSPVVEVGDGQDSSQWQISKEDRSGTEVGCLQLSLAPETHSEEDDLPSAYRSQREVGHSHPSSVFETNADDLPFSYKRQMVLAPGEGSQDDEEELGEISHVGAQDEPEKWTLLGDKDLSVPESDLSSPRAKLNLFCTNDQINLKNWGKLDLLCNRPLLEESQVVSLG